MHILEIIQTSVSSYKSKNQFKDEKDIQRASDYIISDDPKFGASGRIHDRQDSHVVAKRNYVSEYPERDGYFSYIKAIVDGKLYEDNPFFPRVYKIKTLADSTGKAKYKIDLERLVKLQQVDDAVIIALRSQLYDEEQIQNLYNDRFGIREGLAQAIYLTCKNKLRSKDDKLNFACDLINKIVKSNDSFELDVHKNNIMIRLAPYPQLVVVDPISQFDAS